jgi:hypothetical protein
VVSPASNSVTAPSLETLLGQDGLVISLPLARRLRDGGLRWDPRPGDRFVVADRNMDDEVFTLAEMTVDVHDFPTGRVIGFNGTVEWALDSIRARECVWLPSEEQLRDRLAGTFESLQRADNGWRVVLRVGDARYEAESADAADAYGLALLHLITGE